MQCGSARRACVGGAVCVGGGLKQFRRRGVGQALFAAGIVAADVWLVGFCGACRDPPPQKALEDACGQYPVADVEKLYPDSLFWAAVLCAVPVCQCGQKFLPLYKYEMDAHLLAVALLMNYHEKQFVNKLSLAWLVIGFAGSVYYCSFVQGDENELLPARLTCGVVVAWGAFGAQYPPHHSVRRRRNLRPPAAR